MKEFQEETGNLYNLKQLQQKEQRIVLPKKIRKDIPILFKQVKDENIYYTNSSQFL
jgi:hypothetical protein